MHSISSVCHPWGMSLLMLRWAPRALEGGSSQRQHLLGVGREDCEWGRRNNKGASPEDIEMMSSCIEVAGIDNVAWHNFPFTLYLIGRTRNLASSNELNVAARE